MKKILHILLVIVLLDVTPSWAQEIASGQVEITGDTLVVAENKNTATFSGNVIIKQPGLTVWANKVVISYGTGGAADIESLSATGNLRIKTPDQTVTGNNGVYDPKARVMRVTGNVVTKSASGTVSGPELLVNFVTNTTEFVGRGKGRVTGVFNN